MAAPWSVRLKTSAASYGNNKPASFRSELQKIRFKESIKDDVETLQEIISNAFVDKRLELFVATALILVAASVVRRFLLRNVIEQDDRRQIRKALPTVTFFLVVFPHVTVQSSHEEKLADSKVS